MILTLLGGGGFRVPLVHRALLTDSGDRRVTQLRLYDTDASRLETMRRVLADQAASADRAGSLAVSVHTGLDEALAGADVVFSAMRVGGTGGRALDERVALDHGVIGQETVGAGGLSYALRGIPVARRVAEAVRRVAPDAFFINFTNPAGILTEVLGEVLGDRVVGICDSPVGLARHAVGALRAGGLAPEDAVLPGLGQGTADGTPMRVRYAGLNHLGWLTGIEVTGARGSDVGGARGSDVAGARGSDAGGENLLPALLARPDLLTGTEEGKLFGADWIRRLGVLPNEYLHYFYFQREAHRGELDAELTRGAFLARQQGQFFADGPALPAGKAFPAWDRIRGEREATYMADNRAAAGGFERAAEDLESGGYERVALAVMRAIRGDEPAELILDVPNRGLLPYLPDDAVVEVPAAVDSSGVRPLPVDPLPLHAAGLVSSVKACERAVIRAAREGSRELAVEAFALHPLIDGVGTARALVDAYREAFPGELAYLR